LPPFPIGLQIANKKQGGALKNFQGFSEDGVRAKFSENIRASPFD
jgi:hypothetical protein